MKRDRMPPIRPDLDWEVAFTTKLKGLSIDELEQELGFCCKARGARSREAKVAYELLKRLKGATVCIVSDDDQLSQTLRNTDRDEGMY